ncbi:MAG TPA: ribonuclease PH [Candidatus Krumholzibacteriaceae bacterium]|nr:ribonuclease PH [Candidatus Krumholzibacteriaceae bacterium]
MPRNDGRTRRDQLRTVKITRNYIRSAENSVLLEMGNTRVICVASIEEKVPPFLRGTGQGWITAEYSMLPRSSPVRIARESRRGRLKGRTQEIQRLIGRSLRAAVDLEKIGPRTITVDCDVIEADGGTRTASINGSFIALAGVLKKLKLADEAIKFFIGAVSVGILGGRVYLDIDYSEDVKAEVDMNIVMNENGDFIEVQGTAEEKAFTSRQLSSLVKSAGRGITKIIEREKRCLKWT